VERRERERERESKNVPTTTPSPLPSVSPSFVLYPLLPQPALPIDLPLLLHDRQARVPIVSSQIRLFVYKRPQVPPARPLHQSDARGIGRSRIDNDAWETKDSKGKGEEEGEGGGSEAEGPVVWMKLVESSADDLFLQLLGTWVLEDDSSLPSGQDARAGSIALSVLHLYRHVSDVPIDPSSETLLPSALTVRGGVGFDGGRGGSDGEDVTSAGVCWGGGGLGGGQIIEDIANGKAVAFGSGGGSIVLIRRGQRERRSDTIVGLRESKGKEGSLLGKS
jgi:hypothetical protein